MHRPIIKLTGEVVARLEDGDEFQIGERILRALQPGEGRGATNDQFRILRRQFVGPVEIRQRLIVALAM